MNKSDAIKILNKVRDIVDYYETYYSHSQSVSKQLKLEGKKELARAIIEIMDEE